MIVRNLSETIDADSGVVLRILADELDRLTPQLRKAAVYLLDHPQEIGVSSVREIAEAAGVTANTVVRMARSIGFSGYEDFREPFRKEIRNGALSFPDRARWIQSLARSDSHGTLYADMARSVIANVEATFAATDSERLKVAADAIVSARHTYVLGVGVYYTLARNFAYLADMAFDSVEAIPRLGSNAVDDLSKGKTGDVLLAMTSEPYRTEVVAAVRLARDQGMTVIGISDSRASPIISDATHGFVAQFETPLFFSSNVGPLVLLETLMAFVIAQAPEDAVARIEAFHLRRAEIGLYQNRWTRRR